MIQKLISEIQRKNAPVVVGLDPNLSFVPQHLLEQALKDVDPEVDIIGEPTGDVYRRYSVFCHENGFNAIGKTVFSRQICSMLQLDSVVRRVNGKNRRIYIK